MARRPRRAAGGEELIRGLVQSNSFVIAKVCTERPRGLSVGFASEFFLSGTVHSTGAHAQGMMLAVALSGCSPRTFARRAYTFLSKPKARSDYSRSLAFSFAPQMQYWELLPINGRVLQVRSASSRRAK
jgi:hypothetical protein